MPESTPRPSIALRMSAWYAISVTLLIFAAVGTLYLSLASRLEREDERVETDVVGALRVILAGAPQASFPPVSGAPADHQIYLRVLGPDGAVRHETPGMRRLLPPPSLEWLRALPAHPVETEGPTPDGHFFETHTAKLAADGSDVAGFVQVSMNRTEDESLLAVFRRRMIAVLGLALLATVLAGYLIARAAMSPIRRISAAAAEIGPSNLHARISREVPVELASLVEVFNSMLDSLEDAFARISRFSDDAAHELRTPINNMRGELEVALSRARTPDQYREALSSALEESDRLGQIVRSLMFLARADTRSALHREEVDVGHELAAVRDFYEAAASEQGVALRLEVKAPLVASLDRTMFQQAVGNLVSNAITHTPPGGEIRMRASRLAEGIWLEVSDTGSGVAPEHLPHVFERFYRADASRGGVHVGLGLAVVRSIAERHGGWASMDSALGQGTRVELYFAGG